MDISRLERPQNKNFTLHNNLLSSVTNARDTTHIPSVITKEGISSCYMYKSKGKWKVLDLCSLKYDKKKCYEREKV